jgi:L-serine dehydratase
MSQMWNVEDGTVWPMQAARRFALTLRHEGVLDRTWRIKCELHRAPGSAGRDHAIETAVLRGLEGDEGEHPDLAAIDRQVRRIRIKHELCLMGMKRIVFDRRHHFLYGTDSSTHGMSNAMRLSLSAYDPGATPLLQRSYECRESDALPMRAQNRLQRAQAAPRPALAW